MTDWNADSGEGSEFVAAYNADIVGLGVKADLKPLNWLQVYTTAQGLLYMGKIRLDEDSETRTNTGQIKASGISGGAQLLGGVEFQLRKQKAPLGIGLYLEAGYGLVAKHSYRGPKDVNADPSGFSKEDSLSTMSPSGFVLRTGIGARF